MSININFNHIINTMMNNNDSDSDYNSESEDEKINYGKKEKYSNDEIEKIKIINKNKNAENTLPTEGIKENDMKYKKNYNYQFIAIFCEYCNSYYDKRMTAKCEFGDIICQHCYFFLNFSDPQPKYGWTLEKYIELCQSEHDKNKCQKFANGGGCHLCLYLSDLEVLKKNQNQNKTNQTSIKEDIKLRKIIFSDESQKDKLQINSNQVIVL